MIIGGEEVEGETRLDIVNPATGEVFATPPAGTAAHVDLAVESARKAFDGGDFFCGAGARESTTKSSGF